MNDEAKLINTRAAPGPGSWDGEATWLWPRRRPLESELDAEAAVTASKDRLAWRLISGRSASRSTRPRRRAMRRIVPLIVNHAKLGKRPPLPDPPTPGPHFAANGKPRIVIDTGIGALPTKAIRGSLYEPGARCPLAWEPDPQALVYERAEYAAWWAGLDLLAQELSGKLESFAALSPSAPERPWAGDLEKGKPGAFTGRVHVTKDRAAAEAERRTGARRPLRAPPPRYPMDQVYKREKAAGP